MAEAGDTELVELTVTQHTWAAKTPRTYAVAVAPTTFAASFTQVWPQRGLSRLIQLAGFRDVDVESAAFNARWRAFGTDVGASSGCSLPWHSSS